MTHIGHLIKQKRMEVGISQKDLGETIGFQGGQYISNLERGKCTFPPSYIAKLSKALRLDSEAIIRAMVADCRDKLKKYAKK